MTIPLDIDASESGLGSWSILTGYRGSIAHNMYVPKNDPNSIDDKDVMAVCVPSKSYYLGTDSYGHQGNGTKEIKRAEWDIVIYEARKMISLLKKGNPNVLSMLWLDEKHYLHRTPAGDLLIQNRDLFVGQHVYHSFVGYAHGQLHRMTHLATDAAYMGKKRREVVQEHGYDTKNAAHLIRILRMGAEFLKDGYLHVARPDNNQLLDIKRGEWTLDQVKAEAERQFIRAQEAFDRSTLPLQPDSVYVNGLCVRIIETAWAERGGE